MAAANTNPRHGALRHKAERRCNTMAPVFKNARTRAEAERLLAGGIESGSWSAAGFALLTDRLDSLLSRMDRLADRQQEMLAYQEKLLSVLAGEKVGQR
jgi:hypothetical protein